MAIKKISEFVSAVPSSDSKILFEQNEKGKSCTISDAVNTCSLSYDEIMATNPEPDLAGKVASASAVQAIGARIKTGFFRVRTTANTAVLVRDNKLEGTLPTTTNTYFIVIGNSSNNAHITNFLFDNLQPSDLIVYSNVSQNIGVNWVSFY